MANIIDGAEAPEGVDLIDFEDFGTRRNLMFSKAKDTLEKQFPKEHNGVRIELQNVHYVDPERYSIQQQKQMLMDEKFLIRRLRGDMILKDANTGDILDAKENMTLMRVPYLTNRGTFVHNGSELGTISQQRLLPGAYSRIQANGELETQFNTRPGTGAAFKVSFDPTSAIYRFSSGGGNVPLYSLLRSIGVSDDDLRKRWGDEVFEANAKKYDPTILDKAYEKIVPAYERKKVQNPNREQKAEKIKEALNAAQITTFVAKKTLPNLFSREKSAAWRAGGKFMEKAANASKQDIVDIANYLNKACDASINVDVPSMDDILAQIRTFIVTGLPDGDVNLGKFDASNEAASYVRMNRIMAAVNKFNSKVPKAPTVPTL